MKIKIFLASVALLALVLAGCVSKVSGGKTAGMPFLRDTVEGRYERPLDEVFNAAKQVISQNGVLSNESIVHGETNQVKTVVGKVNQRTVYIKITPVEAQITSILVQARTQNGGSDIDLAHELEKQVALKLVR
jgi:hypothetical protein